MKAAKRKASRRGKKRVRTPEELEIKSTLAAIRDEQEEAEAVMIPTACCAICWSTKFRQPRRTIRICATGVPNRP